MKTLCAVLLVAFVCSAVAQKYIQTSTNRYCRRKISAPTLGPLGYSVSFRTDINCKTNAGVQRNGVLFHDFTSSPLPTFRVRAWKRAQDVAAGAAFYFASRFAVDSIYEYNETNGVPGYQFGSDQLIKTYSLFDTYKKNKWSVLNINTVPVNSAVNVEEIYTSLAQNDIAAMTFGVKLTTDEVTDTSNNITKIVLDTVSFKSLLTLSNITYASSDPNVRLAIGGILISKGGLFNVTTMQSSTSDGERPDENTSNQGVTGINSDDNSTTSGFFSFQRKVYAQNQSGNFFVANLLAASYVVPPFNNITLLADESGFTIRRVFLSLYEQKLTSFTWDPSIGALEAPENAGVGGASFPTNAPTPMTSSATKTFSVTIMIIVLLVQFLF